MKTPIGPGKLSKESAPTIKTPSLPPAPGEIRDRAYDIFLARGGAPGNDVDDWLLAEQQLKEERTRPKEPSDPRYTRPRRDFVVVSGVARR
jgi:hypothetical protein